MFKKNTAVTGFTVGLVSSTDGSDITTGTPVGYYTLDGGTQTAIGDVTPVHEGNGQWSFDLTAAEMNGDIVGLTFTHTSAITAHFTIKTDTKIVSDLNDIAATAIVSAGAITTLSGAVVNVDTVDTTTTNTDMRGTDSAALATVCTEVRLAELDAANLPAGVDSNGVAIGNLNDFDPAVDTVANVGTVQSVVNTVNSFVQGFLSTLLTETTAGRIAGNFDTFFENADAATTKVVDDVGGAGGASDWTVAERNEIRGRIGITGTTAAGGNTPTLALESSIAALNDFDPALDTVANVTTVATNTDMRGTDGANTVAPDNASITAILADTADMQPKLGTPATDISTDIAAVKTDTGTLATDWADGGRLDLLIDQLITQIDTAAGEPGQTAPPVSAKMGLKVDYIYKFLRNRSTSTATTISVYADDASTVDHKSTHSDDGTTYDRGEFATGP